MTTVFSVEAATRPLARNMEFLRFGPPYLFLSIAVKTNGVFIHLCLLRDQIKLGSACAGQCG